MSKILYALPALNFALAGQLTADDRHRMGAIFTTRCHTYWFWYWRNNR